MLLTGETPSDSTPSDLPAEEEVRSPPDGLSHRTEPGPEQDEYTVDPSKWTLSPLVDEIRQKYNGEEARRSIVETKISFVVAVDALIVSLSGSGFFPRVGPLLFGLLLFPAISSAVMGLYQMRVRAYTVPFASFEDYYRKYAPQSETEILDNILISYIDAVRDNARLNSEKYRFLNICLVLTAVSLSAVVLSPAGEYLGLLGPLQSAVRQRLVLSAGLYVLALGLLGWWAYSRDVKSLE